MRFVIHRKYFGKELDAIILYSVMNKIPKRFVNNAQNIENDEVPVGDVNFIQKALGYNVIPDYYPSFLNEFISRKIWFTDKWPVNKVFIKPADKYKRFTGFVTCGRYKKKKKGPYYCSEIVNFKNEFRYYISNGEVVFSSWYYGDNEDSQTPQLDIIFDKNLCGCLDMGILENNKLELVEFQHPFSCGWYGDVDIKGAGIYSKWIIEGWKYMKNKNNLKKVDTFIKLYYNISVNFLRVDKIENRRLL